WGIDDQVRAGGGPSRGDTAAKVVGSGAFDLSDHTNVTGRAHHHGVEHRVAVSALRDTRPPGRPRGVVRHENGIVRVVRLRDRYPAAQIQSAIGAHEEARRVEVARGVHGDGAEVGTDTGRTR